MCLKTSNIRQSVLYVAKVRSGGESFLSTIVAMLGCIPTNVYDAKANSTEDATFYVILEFI